MNYNIDKILPNMSDKENKIDASTLHTFKKGRKKKKKITPELVTKILEDRYHNCLSVTKIKNKYGIGHKTYQYIDSFSKLYIEKFGKKESNKISENDLVNYWCASLDLSSTPKKKDESKDLDINDESKDLKKNDKDNS